MRANLGRIILFAQDVAGLALFYRSVFGFSIVEQDGADWMVLNAGGTELALHRVGPEYRRDDAKDWLGDTNVKLVITVDEDLEALRERLLDMDVRLGEIKRFSPTAPPLCDGRDPEGNVFQICQSAGPADLPDATDIIALTSRAAHDLKAPLRHVTTALSIIEEEIEGPLPEEAAEWMDIARGAGAQLLALIEDIRTYVRAAYTPLDRQSIALIDIIDATAAEIGQRPESRGADVRRDGDGVVVQGDPAQTNQLIRILVSNAVAYVPPDRQPDVTVAIGHEPDGAFMRVRDNGIGLDERGAERIFEPFVRLKQVEAPGSGLGLAIARVICARHGWTVAAEPSAADGATLLVRFGSGLP